MNDDARAGEHVVLVVEDDEDVRLAVCEALEDEGYAAAQAENGLAALEYLRQHQVPCLVLLDMMMPVMSGYDFLAEVRSDPQLRDVSVLIVSAGEREQLAVAARERAAVGVLRKPVQLRSLLNFVARHC